MDGLLPDRATFDAWSALSDAGMWAGVDAGLLRCVCRQLGDAELSSLQALAVIPSDVVEQALSNALRGGRALLETDV